MQMEGELRGLAYCRSGVTLPDHKEGVGNKSELKLLFYFKHIFIPELLPTRPEKEPRLCVRTSMTFFPTASDSVHGGLFKNSLKLNWSLQSTAVCPGKYGRNLLHDLQKFSPYTLFSIPTETKAFNISSSTSDIMLIIF